MTYLTKFQNNIIDQKIKKFAEQLSEEKQSSGYYITRRAANPRTVFLNLIGGKKAEFIAAQALHEIYKFPLIEPDLEVRRGKSKGWECDLPYPKPFPPVHVKLCTASTQRFAGQCSWTFQLANANGYKGQDNLFNLSGECPDFVALMYMEKELSAEGELMFFLPWVHIVDYLRDPVKESLRGLKKCIYYKDLISC